MKIRDLYSEYIANFINNGFRIPRDGMSDLGIKATFDRFITKKAITKVWYVRAMPVNFKISLSSHLRDYMFKRFPDVVVTVHAVGQPQNPPVMSDTYRRQYTRAQSRYDEMATEFEKLPGAEKEMGTIVRNGSGVKRLVRRSDLDKLKDNLDSYAYVYSHRTRNKPGESPGEFFTTYLFVQAAIPDNETAKKFTKELVFYFKAQNIIFSEIKGSINHYLRNFAPAAYIQDPKIKYDSLLMSDENISHISPYKARGLINSSGVLLGLDQLGRLPFFADFFATSAAQVILVAGVAGSGKTALVQMASMGFLAENVHVSAVDVKGGEWSKLEPFVDNILVISFSSAYGRYVQLMRLDDMPVTKENCLEIYEMGVQATVQFFSLVVSLNENEGNIVDLETRLEEAVRKAYTTQSGFNPYNPDTFWMTRNLNYEIPIDILNELKNSPTNEPIKTMLDKAVSRLSRVFKGAGRLNNFKEEITLADVINAPFVSYSLDKNQSSINDVTDDMKIFMLHHLSRKKHYVRKQQGLHSVEIYEEVSRAEDISVQKSSHSSQLLKSISHTVTGSRSDNVTIFLLTNSVNILANHGFKAIKSNVTSVIGGKLSKDDVDLLVDSFNCRSIENYLRIISEGEDPKYQNNFAVRIDNGKKVSNALVKAVIPSHIEEGLRQRDVIESI